MIDVSGGVDRCAFRRVHTRSPAFDAAALSVAAAAGFVLVVSVSTALPVAAAEVEPSFRFTFAAGGLPGELLPGPGRDGQNRQAPPADVLTTAQAASGSASPTPSTRGNIPGGSIAGGATVSEGVRVVEPAAPRGAGQTTPRSAAPTTPNAPAATPGAAAGKDWPRLLPGKAGPPDPAQAAPAAWTPAEIAEEKARCTQLLKGLKLVVVDEAPIRVGACGAPAPVKLISIGDRPQVSLSPPPVMTCEMVAAMATWVQNDIQRLAKAHLGSAVIRIDTMSDYSCRNAYGRRGGRLSEHGKANALDIRGFILQDGSDIDLLTHWGPTERDIRNQIAADRAAAIKRAAEAQRTAPPTVPQPAAPAAPQGGPAAAGTDVAGSISRAGESLGKAVGQSLGVPPPSRNDRLLGLTPPARLGGPKDKGSAARAADAIAARSRFLREVHAAGCRIFGTILGPESNEAHRNHFHVDMAERNNGNYCE